MNLHAIVSPYIRAVNPMLPVTAQIMIGYGPTAANGSRAPKYATPGGFTGSIAGTVLTVSAVASGIPQPGQQIAGAGIIAGTAIAAAITIAPDGTGTYALTRDYTGSPISSEPMTTTMTLLGQIQPLSYRDLQQIEGLNLGGERRKIYVNGDLNGTVRVELKGGDLITTPDGFVWLVAQSIESWATTAGWTAAVLTLQNGS